MNHILGYTIMLDITARELQAEAKRKRMPWGAPRALTPSHPWGPRWCPGMSWTPGTLR